MFVHPYKIGVTGYSAFNRNDPDKICRILSDSAFSDSGAPPVFGLVLAGGKSKRMGRSKALLDYHGKPQIVHCLELLDSVCEKSFVSCRRGQFFDHPGDLPYIFDRFLEMGPLGGILSAMTKFPGVAWMVVGCDMPLLTRYVLTTLRKSRNHLKMATCFRSDRGVEPLCTIWEPKSGGRLISNAQKGAYSLRKILNSGPCQWIRSTCIKELSNINYEHEFRKIKQELSTRSGR